MQSSFAPKIISLNLHARHTSGTLRSIHREQNFCVGDFGRTGSLRNCFRITFIRYSVVPSIGHFMQRCKITLFLCRKRTRSHFTRNEPGFWWKPLRQRFVCGHRSFAPVSLIVSHSPSPSRTLACFFPTSRSLLLPPRVFPAHSANHLPVPTSLIDHSRRHRAQWPRTRLARESNCVLIRNNWPRPVQFGNWTRYQLISVVTMLAVHHLCPNIHGTWIAAFVRFVCVRARLPH